jgi:hypothetical protein
MWKELDGMRHLERKGEKLPFADEPSAHRRWQP